MEKEKINLAAKLEEIRRGQEQNLAFLSAHGHELDVGPLSFFVG